MAKKEEKFSEVSYVLGITSIVFAFFTPLAGLILGIVGLIQNRNQKTELSKKAKTLNILGIVLSIIVMVVLSAVFYLRIINNLLV
jgi:uncharacterized membrane protein|tara:strand:- start:6743 stop:6997 length:255 start_codon:yes stop_codon:yes gene_type:complete